MPMKVCASIVRHVLIKTSMDLRTSRGVRAAVQPARLAKLRGEHRTGHGLGSLPRIRRDRRRRPRLGRGVERRLRRPGDVPPPPATVAKRVAADTEQTRRTHGRCQRLRGEPAASAKLPLPSCAARRTTSVLSVRGASRCSDARASPAKTRRRPRGRDRSIRCASSRTLPAL